MGATRDPQSPASGEQPAQGRVYLYGRSDPNFVASAQLQADSGDEEDHFGDVVVLTDNYLIAGAREEDGGSCGIDGDRSDNTQADSGAVYVLH